MSTVAPVLYAPEGLVQPGSALATAGAALLEQIATTGDVWDTTNDLAAPSPDNAFMAPYWDQVAAIVAGAKAIQQGGTTYLPRFPDEVSADYQFRLQNAKFTNIYRDILEGLSSKPFEEEITLDDNAPQSIKDFCDDVDGSGNALTTFALGSFFNSINDAINWIFIDYSKGLDNAPVGRALSRQEEADAGLRPYWSRIWAKNMLEVRTRLIGGKKELSYSRILEPGSNNLPNRVRIFQRADKVVIWTLWEKRLNTVVNKEQWFRVDAGDVSIGVIPLVPVIIGRRNGETWQFYPPMRDAADLQIELYQQESGLKHARTLTAYPMLVGEGVTPDKTPGTGKPVKLKVGPKTILYSPPNPGGGANGTWKYLEPQATSLTFLASDVEKTTQAMRELGRQPLTAQSGNLTTITAAMGAGKGNSAVSMWAYQLQDSIENALIITSLWLDDHWDAEITVFTEFEIAGETDDFKSVQAMRDGGDLSQDTLWKEAVRRGILSSKFEPDDEVDALANELPGDGLDANPNDPTLLPPGTPPKKPGKVPPKVKPANTPPT